MKIYRCHAKARHFKYEETVHVYEIIPSTALNTILHDTRLMYLLTLIEK